MPPLTAARRSELRARAHGLAPVVLIGDKGLTPSVIAEVDRALDAHGLIKVRATTADRDTRVAWMAELCESLGANAVQVIGKVLVIWRENPEKGAAKVAPAAKAPPKKARARRAPVQKTKGAQSFTKGRGTQPFSRKEDSGAGRSPRGLTRTSRPRSPAPSPRPASAPLRRRPRTSR